MKLDPVLVIDSFTIRMNDFIFAAGKDYILLPLLDKLTFMSI